MAVPIFIVGAPGILTLVELPRLWFSDLDEAGTHERKLIVVGRYHTRVLSLRRAAKRREGGKGERTMCLQGIVHPFGFIESPASKKANQTKNWSWVTGTGDPPMANACFSTRILRHLYGAFVITDQALVRLNSPVAQSNSCEACALSCSATYTGVYHQVNLNFQPFCLDMNLPNTYNIDLLAVGVRANRQVQFFYVNSKRCAPPSKHFRQWSQTVRYVQGTHILYLNNTSARHYA